MLAATALTRICLIVGVTDGDTLTARCPTQQAAHPYQQVKVRLAEIDAPESGQAFGRRSKEYLSRLCYKVEAVLRPTARDRYGRTIARVECRGRDANLAMVTAGLAWAYTRYQTDAAFPAAQRQARAARRGLWVDAHPMAPWEWRRKPVKAPRTDADGCLVGPRGGRYTLTASGRKKYGCGR